MGVVSMDRNRYSYTVEKLTNTIETIATHPGDARQRIAAAYLEFHTLQADDFPEQFRADWEWVIREITKFGPSPDHGIGHWRGSVENTMSRVRNSTAAKVATKLYELYWVVSENKQYR